MTTRPAAFWYLATPYTNYPGGEEAASDLACREAGRLLDHGVSVFCPIAHFHAIRRIIGPRPHAYWLAADRPFMEAAIGLIVLRADGWRDSVGMRHEIDFFRECGKPIADMYVGGEPSLAIAGWHRNPAESAPPAPAGFADRDSDA